MTSSTKIAFTAAALLLAAGSGTGAQAANLPVFGHYIGYETIVSPSAACAAKAGDRATTQLELNTVQNYPVFLTRHVSYDATTGAPVLYKSAYVRKSGTKLAPNGKVTITNVATGLGVVGTYSATYTPFDPNSFGGTVHLSFPTAAGTCTVTRQVVFVRSSAD